MALIIFLPLLNFFLVVITSRYVGKLGVIYLSILNFLLLLIIINKVCYSIFILDISYILYLGTWLNIELLNISWEFLLDPLAISILWIVSLIAFFVHLYSFAYIKSDPHFNRFISYLSLFSFFIFLLVTAGNFIQLFFGWEGVGICSYLLINFWYTRIQANKAAIKAIVINKIGDISYLIAVAFIFSYFKTLDFTILHVLAPYFALFYNNIVIDLRPMYKFCYEEIVNWCNYFTTFCNTLFETNYFNIDLSTYSPGIVNHSLIFLHIDIICFFLFLGVIGKSAQIGLHTWLPAAIEGPTPVSALIHAATIVTAGVFLIIRVSYFFELSPFMRSVIVVIGLVTALLSALTAVFLYDIKKIIAYSTCSQLGYIVVAVGLSHYTLGLFHLINHAFFKALLFLTAGAIIHAINNEQDIRKLSGLFHRIPFIYVIIVIGNIAIIGLPFLSGFYSKDLIIELMTLGLLDIKYSEVILADVHSGFLLGEYVWNVFPFFLLLIWLATAATAVYSFRIFYFLFLRRNIIHRTANWQLESYTQPKLIQFVLTILAIGSIFCGFCLFDFFTTTNSFFYYFIYFKQHINVNTLNDLIIRIIISDDHQRWLYSLQQSLATYIFFEMEYINWYDKLIPLVINVSIFILGNWRIKHRRTIRQYKWNGLYPNVILFLLTKKPARACLYFSFAYRFYLLFSRFRFCNRIIRSFFHIFSSNFYFNEIYNYIAISHYANYYNNIFYHFDKGLLEIFGPQGGFKVYSYISNFWATYFAQGLKQHLFLIYITFICVLWMCV